jgi:hypothetical protein
MSQPEAGALHLGGAIDPASGERGGASYALPARDLTTHGVIIDLSQGAARSLNFIRQGRVRVRLEVVRWGPSTRS